MFSSEFSGTPLFRVNKTDGGFDVFYFDEASIENLKNTGAVRNTGLLDSFGNVFIEKKKFIDFLEINKAYSNNQVYHFEIANLEDKKTQNEELSNSILKTMRPYLNQPVENLGGTWYTLNEMNIRFPNFECANSRDALTEVGRENISDNIQFRPGEKNLLYFQITYIKLMFQELGYDLEKNSFSKSLCIFDLGEPRTFVYLIDNLKYTFTSSFFISMSLLYTKKKTEEKTKKVVGSVYGTRATRQQTVTKLILELYNKFISESVNIKYILYKLAENENISRISTEIYNNVSSPDKNVLVFTNFPLTDIPRRIHQNKEYLEQIERLNDTKNTIKCMTPKNKSQPVCSQSSSFVTAKSQNFQLLLEQTRLEKLIIYNISLRKFYNIEVSQRKLNEPVYRNNAFTSIFLV
jgi:hypothetical protein